MPKFRISSPRFNNVLATPSTYAAVLAAPLGGLTAVIAGTPTVTATLAAPLGGVTATLSGTPKVALTLTASLGGLSSSLTATPGVTLILSAPLGSVTATLGETPTVAVTFSAPLGGFAATCAYTVTPGTTPPTALADAAQGRPYKPPVQYVYGYCDTLTICTTTTEGSISATVETVSASCPFEIRSRLSGRCRTHTATEQRTVNGLSGRAYKPCRDPDEELVALAAFLLSN